MLLSSLILASLPGLAPVATTDTCAAYAPGQDIVETAVAAGSFKTLATALRAADLVGALEGKGPFTVFAPTDAAFAALPKGTLEELLEPDNKALLRSILTYHVVPGAVTAEQVVKLSSAVTLNGQRIDIRANDAGVAVDGAKVSQTDIRCSNGIIHVIDAVIMPSSDDVVATAVANGGFKTLTTAIRAAGLVEALEGEGPFTVFAPTDAAFAALPEGTLESLLTPEGRPRLQQILKNHVVAGRVFSDAAAKGAKLTTLAGTTIESKTRGEHVVVSGAKVVEADIDCANGVIHVIDKVLLP